VNDFGEETTLDVFRRGEVVGELVSLDGVTRSARACGIEDSILLSMTKIELRIAPFKSQSGI